MLALTATSESCKAFPLPKADKPVILTLQYVLLITGTHEMADLNLDPSTQPMQRLEPVAWWRVRWKPNMGEESELVFMRLSKGVALPDEAIEEKAIPSRASARRHPFKMRSTGPRDFK